MEDIIVHEKLLKYTDLNRMVDSLAYKVEDLTVASGKVYTVIESNGRSLSPSVDLVDGSYNCTCEDYIFRKPIMCKHIIALLRTLKKRRKRDFETFIASLDKAQNNPTVDSYIPTDVPALDSVIHGVPRGAVFGLVGEPKVGKTFFSYQIAANATRDGGRALFVNTEIDFPAKEMFDKIKEIYCRRYGMQEAKVDVINIDSLVQLCKFFGLQVEIAGEGKKVDARIVPEDFEKSLCHNLIMSGGYRIVVVDSLTAPLKQAIPVPPNQNLPARATVVNMLWGHFSKIVSKFNIPIIVTHHVSKDPQSHTYGQPFGGDTVLYNMKFIVYVLGGSEKERKLWGEEGRRFMVYRYPGIAERIIVSARLKKDWGFTSEEEIEVVEEKATVQSKHEEVLEIAEEPAEGEGGENQAAQAQNSFEGIE